MPIATNPNGASTNGSDNELGRADSTGSQLRAVSGSSGAASAGELSRSPGSLTHAMVSSPSQSHKFRGIRDLEERAPSQTGVTQRKEGLLWAASRPGGHVDPLNLKQQGLHK